MPTFLGKPVKVDKAKQLQVGDIAHDFTLTATDLTKKHLSDFQEKKVISIVPSIDTGLCSTQTRTFNRDLAARPDTLVITVSADLPFAQERWCGAQDLEDVIMLSDYYDNSFAKAYGLLMEEWHLLARAVLVLDETNTVRYTEYLENVNSEPDYEAAIAALKAL
ncbi:thiol peroxidase [Streptococcus dentasini]